MHSRTGFSGTEPDMHRLQERSSASGRDRGAPSQGKIYGKESLCPDFKNQGTRAPRSAEEHPVLDRGVSREATEVPVPLCRHFLQGRLGHRKHRQSDTPERYWQ